MPIPSVTFVKQCNDKNEVARMFPLFIFQRIGKAYHDTFRVWLDFHMCLSACSVSALLFRIGVGLTRQTRLRTPQRPSLPLCPPFTPHDPNQCQSLELGHSQINSYHFFSFPLYRYQTTANGRGHIRDATRLINLRRLLIGF